MKDVISLHSIYTDNNKVINKQIGKQSSIHLPTFHCKKHSSLALNTRQSPALVNLDKN